MIDGVWLIIAGLWTIALLTSHYEDGLQRLADWLEETTEPSPVDEVHQAYLDGEIGEDELENRLEVLVDNRAATIREMADNIDGIGDELSREIAREFDSVADLHAADREALESIEGIGEQRAERLLEEF